MFKINVYIASRNRESHLKVCLHYLNLANKENKYEIRVYINFDDSMCSHIDIMDYSHIIILWNYVYNPGQFNKSMLLNSGLALGIKDFPDAHFVCDCDMIYRQTIFDTLKQKVDEGFDYIVSHGWHLGSDTVDYVKSLPSIKEIEGLNKEVFDVGPSQITITPKCLDLFIRLFGPNLYDSVFCGWGLEDSLVSTKSRYLFMFGQIKKVELKDLWFHQYHTKHDINPDNVSHFDKKNKEVIDFLNIVYKK